jgi:hypothetical protein
MFHTLLEGSPYVQVLENVLYITRTSQDADLVRAAMTAIISWQEIDAQLVRRCPAPHSAERAW